MQVYIKLGKEITTLVDEYKPVENYEVEFNSANKRPGAFFINDLWNILSLSSNLMP